MIITTATRTVEIQANTNAYVTYRNVKDGVPYGPSRTAQATAKAGSVGREVYDAAYAARTAAVEVVEVEATEVEVVEVEAAEVEVVATAKVEVITAGTEIQVAGRKGIVSETYEGRDWVGVVWDDTASAGGRSYGFAYLSQITLA